MIFDYLRTNDKKMALFLTIILALLQAFPFGASSKPIVTSHNLEQISTDTVRLSFNLTISDGWHVYSTSLPDGGPISASLDLDSVSGMQAASPLLFNGNELNDFDQVFGMTVRYFEKKVTFYQNFRISDADWYIAGALTYGACNDESCLPPQRIEFSHKDPAAATAPEDDVEEEIDGIEGYDRLLWAPVKYGQSDQIHPLRMAYHPHDRQFLPETLIKPSQGYT